MNTVLAGRGRRMSVPLLASITMGGPFARTWLTRPGGPASAVAGVAAGCASPGGLVSEAAIDVAASPVPRSRKGGIGSADQTPSLLLHHPAATTSETKL